MEIAYSIYLFVIGLCAGSFANACIYRWVAETSLFPRSRCTVCGHEIAWYDNIPILSYLFLRGKCRHCHTAISLRYPAVELLMGCLFVSAYHIYGMTIMTAKILFLAWMFVVAFSTDIAAMEIPDELCVMGLVAGFVLVLAGYSTWQFFLFGVCIPFVPLFVLSIIASFITGNEEVIGGGDLKFIIGIGAIGGSVLASMVLLFGMALQGVMFLWTAIEDFLTGKRTYVPLAIGFSYIFLLLFLFGALPEIMKPIG